MIQERLSLTDSTILASYAEHIQRYDFALAYCKGKRVLDAGCGTGYGSHFLAGNGATSMLAVDISDDALDEARRNYQAPNLTFEKQNVEELDRNPALRGKFDVVVNFENLEHVPNPELLVQGVARISSPDGVYITSTPNGAISDRDASGRPKNVFHVEEYTFDQFQALLLPHFASITFYGQWLTHSGRLRKQRARELFEQLCETYYNPASRLGRLVKRLFGKMVAPPSQFNAGQDHYPGDHSIVPIDSGQFPWPPEVLIAVCAQPIQQAN
jgi:2-polyprenyl-3-methyl-5-hydroxy-6-metoxy-1,4-benzoquinol methylase